MALNCDSRWLFRFQGERIDVVTAHVAQDQRSVGRVQAHGIAIVSSQMPVSHVHQALLFAAPYGNSKDALVISVTQEVDEPAVGGECGKVHAAIDRPCVPTLCLNIEYRQTTGVCFA